MSTTNCTRQTNEILRSLPEVGYSVCFFFVNSQVKQESLGIPIKMFLKVDVESGKLYFKKSKDGPEDKGFGHNKSKMWKLLFESAKIDSQRVYFM